MTTALDIHDLHVTVGGGVRAVSGITLSVAKGQVTGLLGPSGSGKTTFMKAIVGLQKITSGSVKILGEPAGSPRLRQKLAYMPQALSVYPDLTVSENIRYFGSMRNISNRAVNQECDRVLALVDMTSHGAQMVRTLSGGQKQRVSLATALLGSPEILILDEPTVGLDPLLREDLWKLFYQLADAGVTLIISSHAMDEASRCHSLILLREGKLLASGSPKDLCAQAGVATVEAAFISLLKAQP